MSDAHSRSTDLLERLNTSWQIAGPEPAGASAGRQLLFRIRRMIAAMLRPQETFNASVVEYLNVASTEQAERVQSVRWGLTTALDAAVHSLERALHDLEGRRVTAEDELRIADAELRTSLAVLQRASQMAQRELARLADVGSSGLSRKPQESESSGSSRKPQEVGESAGAGSAVPAVASGTPTVASGTPTVASGFSRKADLDSHKYVGFEDQFRGTPEDIRQRQSEYLPYLQGASDVIDIGCGRGEFLALLREHGITARGIDVNAAMVGVCRDEGLDATVADALTYLRAQPAESLGGIVAAQVIEHLEPGYLMAVVEAAFDALRPGAPIILETINPTCWYAFFDSYLRDFTHAQPIHPETLKYLLIAAGYQRVELRYRAPFPEARKLQPVASTAGAWAATVNANVDKINELLFTYLDFAAIARKP